MKKSDKVYSQMINSINDAEYLRRDEDYIPDCRFPGAPTADRVRATWKHYTITKMKKERKHGARDDSDDDEDMRILRKNEARLKKLNEGIDPI